MQGDRLVGTRILQTLDKQLHPHVLEFLVKVLGAYATLVIKEPSLTTS